LHRAVARAGGDLIFSAAKKRLWLAALLLVPLMPGLVQAQVRLRRSVSPAVAQIVNGRTAGSAMPMEIAVRLNLRNAAELEQLKCDQQDPSSPSYHKWLSAAQFNARFGPTPAAADAVAQWLAGAGFVVTGIDLDRHLITAKASAAVVTQSLDVAIETHLCGQARVGGTGGVRGIDRG
jgi:subtilase family serine protease